MKSAAKRYPAGKLLMIIPYFLLLLALVIGILPQTAAAENTGYVEKIQFTIPQSSTNIPGFQFKKGKTDYYIEIAEGQKNSRLTVTFSDPLEEGVYCKVIGSNNKPVTGFKETPVSAGGTFYGTPVVGLNAVKWNAPQTWRIMIGKKGDNGEYDNPEIYTLHLSLKPALKTLAVKDASGETEYKIEEIVSAYTAAYTVQVPEGMETIKLYPTQAGTNKNVKFCIGETPCEDAQDGVAVTLSEYDKDENGIKEIPFSYRYESGDKSAKTEYVLRVSEKSMTPVIVKQPENVSCDMEDTITLSVEAAPPEGYEETELQYQWVKVINVALGKYTDIPVETNAEFSPPTDHAGYMEYACRVSFNAGDKTFTTITDPVGVKVNLTRIIADLEILLGDNTVTKIGSAPGVIQFRYNYDSTSDYKVDQKKSSFTIRSPHHRNGYCWRICSQSLLPPAAEA